MAIEIVLFDLGGVLVELGGVPRWQQWTGMPADEVWETWLRSPAVRRFECGGCGADEFAAEIIAEFDLPIGADQFVREFARWPVGPYPGAVELVAQVRERVRVACLSNSNVLHWPRVLDEMGLRGSFDVHLASHELGAVKPDAQAFAAALDRLGADPASVLFVDDNALNVDAARAFGFSAELAQGPEEARRQVARYLRLEL